MFTILSKIACKIIHFQRKNQKKMQEKTKNVPFLVIICIFLSLFYESSRVRIPSSSSAESLKWNSPRMAVEIAPVSSDTTMATASLS